MMRQLTLPLMVITLAGCSDTGAPISPQAIPSTVESPSLDAAWEVTEGVVSPESVYVDHATKTVFVSQIGDGGATGKDGDGYLSKFTLDGSVTELKWITGLNAPKGLRSHAGILWVADIDQLVSIDIAKGEVIEKIEVPDAEFLNDVICDADGTVFVSDTMPNRIVQCRDGVVSVFAEGDELEHPNGLLIQEGRLIVGGWGDGIQDDFSTETAGRLYSLDLQTKEKQLITEQPLGNLDGLEADGEGGFIVTDWIAGKVMRVSADGDAEVLLQLGKGTADHAYLAETGLVIVPRMIDNRISAYQLED